MRRDLDRLMAERNLNAFLIPATETDSSHRDYITGGVKAHCAVIKKQGADAVLIANPMEVDEAAKSGLQVMTFNDFDWAAIVKEHGRGTFKAQAALWTAILDRFDIQGRITIFGHTDTQYMLRMVSLLQDQLANRIELVTDETPDIIALASETKDPDELIKLRDVGKRTGYAMQQVRAWISTHREQDGQVVNAAGERLTIGDVKRYLRLRLLEQDLEDGGVTIFAQGRDAGVPHSRGESNQILRTGESIVFDLFPRQIGGGYYHDMTRTWCIGHAREDVARDFRLVSDIYWKSLEGISLGQPTNILARQVCEWFEAAGHATQLNTPGTTEGYVHSLGHGLGLDVHESPGVSHLSPDSTVWKAGNVVTIEPGLYYPSKGYGIRVEDTVYVDENGNLENLSDCPYDLVIPLQG